MWHETDVKRIDTEVFQSYISIDNAVRRCDFADCSSLNFILLEGVLEMGTTEIAESTATKLYPYMVVKTNAQNNILLQTNDSGT